MTKRRAGHGGPCPPLPWTRPDLRGERDGTCRNRGQLEGTLREKGPRLTTEEIVAWIDRLGGFGSSHELIQYAKKMKARQYARLVEFEDEKSGLRIKRLWSFYDTKRSRRFYIDILEMPDEQRDAPDPPVRPISQAASLGAQGDVRLLCRPAVL